MSEQVATDDLHRGPDRRRPGQQDDGRESDLDDLPGRPVPDHAAQGQPDLTGLLAVSHTAMYVAEDSAGERNMDLKSVLDAVQSWPAEERLRLIEEVWDGLADDGHEPGLTEDVKDLIAHFVAAAKLCVDPEVPGFSTRFMVAADADRMVREVYLDVHRRFIESKPPLNDAALPAPNGAASQKLPLAG